MNQHLDQERCYMVHWCYDVFLVLGFVWFQSLPAAPQPQPIRFFPFSAVIPMAVVCCFCWAISSNHFVIPRSLSSFTGTLSSLPPIELVKKRCRMRTSKQRKCITFQPHPYQSRSCAPCGRPVNRHCCSPSSRPFLSWFSLWLLLPFFWQLLWIFGSWILPSLWPWPLLWPMPFGAWPL